MDISDFPNPRSEVGRMCRYRLDKQQQKHLFKSTDKIHAYVFKNSMHKTMAFKPYTQAFHYFKIKCFTSNSIWVQCDQVQLHLSPIYKTIFS